MSAAVRAADQELDIRERIVTVLDELDQDDPGSARFYLQGLLEDIDQAVAEANSTPRGGWVL